MSTKSTISYSPNEFHLYEDLWDADHVWLEVEGDLALTLHVSANHKSVTVGIPVQAFRKIVDDWAKSYWGQHPENDRKA